VPGGSNYPINSGVTGAVNTNTGQYSLQFPFGLVPDGVYTAYVQATDGIPGDVLTSTTATFTIKTVGPQTGPSLAILSGDVVPPVPQAVGAGRTIVRRPRLTGQTDPGAIVNIYQIFPGANPPIPRVLQATTPALSVPSGGHPAGYFQAQLPNDLVDGTITLQAYATDFAGNTSPAGSSFTLTIFSVKGDYAATGTANLGVFYPAFDGWYIRNGNGTNSSVFFGAANRDVPVPGDYLGNGVTNVAVFDPLIDTWYIDRTPIGSSSPPVVTSVQFGLVGKDVPVPAGYDAIGFYNIAVYRPSTSQWFILHNSVNAGSTGSTQVVSFGPANGGFKPVPGDYEGVQSDQIALYDPSTGNWYVRNSTTPGVTDPVVNVGGKAGDIPVPADYDGIGRTEEAVYRPSTGQFLIYNPITKAIRTVAVGPRNTAVPVPEDYTGDGKTDAAVFVSGTPSQWIYIDSTTGNTVTKIYGSAPSIALPGPLQYRINGATGGNSGIPGGASAGGSSTGSIVQGGGSGSAVTAGGSSSSSSTSGSSSTRAAIVVGGAPAPGSTATGKASNRPNSGTAAASAQGGFKLASGKGHKAKKAVAVARKAVKLADAEPARKATPVKTSHDLALEHLGRAHKGRFFG
jgi:hypothetical protein